MQINIRDVEAFCIFVQKFLIVILDNKVFQRRIICAYTQILRRDVEVFYVHAQKFLVMNLDNKVSEYSSNPRLYSGFAHMLK